MDWTNAFETSTAEDKYRAMMQEKTSDIIDYYMHNMLDEPEIIRDALEFYFECTSNMDIKNLHKDLFGNLDRR
jgi:hypothetical protein